MSGEPVRCPTCGAPISAVGAVCPACLFRAGAPDETIAASDLTMSAVPDQATRLSSPGTAAGAVSPSAVGPTGLPLAIGPYRIVSLLGEGGMGVVYLAEQTEPIRRTVALKVIKLGMDTRDVVARFESERQALALMDHPNIARVIDAGATPDGRPFFVMEHVAGVPITDYCDAHRLSTRARLGLLAQVCGAVQHAHQKGVIHRDLKPSNVLVGEQDGTPVPKIIDFGIAKATDQRLTERTMFTEQGQFIGTPEYMSPEQTLGVLDIDATTDIYALGVILYELLAGSLPFEATTLRRAGYAEMQRIIREDEPPKPSTKVSAQGATASDMAGRRQTDAGSLRKLLAGDLDWITLKALEKDRSRRYASASEFAADIGRYLNDEPVLASPPSLSYRAHKFVRRHRLAVSAAAVVSVAVLGGLGVSSVLYVKEGIARRDADTSRLEASARAQSEKEQRVIAESATRAESTARMAADAARAAADAARQEAEERGYEATILLADSYLRARDNAGAAEALRGIPISLRRWEWQYLWSRARVSGDFLTAYGRAHRARVSTATSDDTFRDWWAVSAGGREAVWTTESTVTRFDLATRKRLRVDGPFQWILALSADGQVVADKVPDGKPRAAEVFDSTSVEILRTAGAESVVRLDGHDSDVLSAALSADGRIAAVGTGSGAVFLWDAVAGRQLGRLASAGRPITAVEFNADGTKLVTIDRLEVKVWDVAARQPLQTFAGAGSIARFSASGQRLLIAFGDGPRQYAAAGRSAFRSPVRSGRTGAVQIRDLTSGRVMTSFVAEDQISSVALSPDDALVAVAGFADGRRSLGMWDVSTPNPKKIGAAGDVRSTFLGYTTIVFSPDGSRLLAGIGGFQSAKLWETRTITGLRVAGRGEAFSVAFDGERQAAVFSPTGSVHLISLTDPVTARNLPDSAGIVAFIGIRGRRLISGGGKDVTIRDLDSGQVLRRIDVGTNASAGALTQDRRFLASASGSLVKIWDIDAASDAPPTTVECAERVRAMVFAPDGGQLLVAIERSPTGPQGPALFAWDRRTGRLRAIQGEAGPAQALALSPDGTQVAVAVSPGMVHIWTSDFTRQIASFELPSQVPDIFEFTPDGAGLLVDGGFNDRQVRLHSAATGRLLITMPPTDQFRLSRNGNWLAMSLTAERATRLFDLTVAAGETTRPADARDDLAARHATAWATVRMAKHTQNDYRSALVQATALVNDVPWEASFLTTLAFAQYRTGRYAESLESVVRADTARRRLPDYDNQGSFGPFVSAMSFAALGRVAQANSALAEARRMTDLNGVFAKSAIASALLAEAEAVVAAAAKRD